MSMKSLVSAIALPYIASHSKSYCFLSTVEDVMPVFECVLRNVLEGTMTVDNLEVCRAKVYVALNEIVHLGEVANTDADLILKLAKMKPLD
jgi:hypothetical protein